MAAKRSYQQAQYLFLSIQAAGDLLFAFLGLSLAYWIRFHTPMFYIGFATVRYPFATYLPLVLLGAILMSATLAYLNLYDGRLLLRIHKAISIIFKGTVFWFFVFLGTSLVLYFDPPVSRIFAGIACLAVFGSISSWRLLFNWRLKKSRFRMQLEQRVAIAGWNEKVAEMCDAISNDRSHPYEVHGIIIQENGKKQEKLDGKSRDYPILGTLAQLDEIFESRGIDILILAEPDLPKNEVLRVAIACEQHYVDFKVIPSHFQIFISGLHLQMLSGLPILGVERLKINRLINQLAKRVVDVIGSLVGLAISIPLIGILALLIKRESPGPVFYKQLRTGVNGSNFCIYKLRSMRVDAEANGALWAVKNDPRRTKIGAFMRATNLDEIPQFWNVLKGDMSLVGPRPERPELIANFKKEIPHYNPRHVVKPGITGWAQVNGLRGDTSLEERIRHDLYYIENWSLWLDFQILVMTFYTRKNAY